MVAIVKAILLSVRLIHIAVVFLMRSLFNFFVFATIPCSDCAMDSRASLGFPVDAIGRAYRHPRTVCQLHNPPGFRITLGQALLPPRSLAPSNRRGARTCGPGWLDSTYT